jgi:shikimate kinase
MKIFLIGFMKSGKSTVTELISCKYKVKAYYLDELFVLKYGPIYSYFNDHGEDTFRQKESEILRDIEFNENCIVSTGGGIVEREDNMSYIKSQGKIIYLYNNLSTLKKREDNELRPNWNDNTLEALYKRRHVLYQKLADYTIDNVDLNLTVKRVAKYGNFNLHK